VVIHLGVLGDGGEEGDRRIGAVGLEDDVVAPVEAVQCPVQVCDPGAGDGIVLTVWICHQAL
jgi:hypothetical protein